MALLAVGCNVDETQDLKPDAPLPIEFYFTVSDEDGANLLDQSREDAIPEGEISVIYRAFTYFPDEEKEGLVLRPITNLDGTLETLYFGQIDGSINIESDPVTLVAGSHTFTVVLVNFFDPASYATADRHYFWHNQDWYGKPVIPFVVEQEKESVPPGNLIDVD